MLRSFECSRIPEVGLTWRGGILDFFRFEREWVSLGSHNLALRRKKKRVWSRVHVLAVAVVVSVPMADGTNMGMVSEAQMGTTWALLCSYYFWMHTVV